MNSVKKYLKEYKPLIPTTRLEWAFTLSLLFFICCVTYSVITG